MTVIRAHIHAMAGRPAGRALVKTAWLCGVVALASACATSNTTSSGGSQPYAEIENERLPLNEADCLDGEYFDRATESCEPLENSGENAAPGGNSPHLDIPGSASPGVSNDSKK